MKIVQRPHGPLPLAVPVDIGIDNAFRYETELGPNVGAIDCAGRIAGGEAGAEKDIVVTFRFEDGHGELLTGICEGLAYSDAVGDFFYPLKYSRDGIFLHRLDLRTPAAKVVVTVLLWRPRADATYTLEQFEIRPKHHDMRFSPVPDFRRARESLAWILVKIESVKRRPLNILDVASNGDCAKSVTKALAGPDRNVDCVRLTSGKVADSRFIVEGARLLPGTVKDLPRVHHYDILVVSNHVLNWQDVGASLNQWEGLLEDEGFVILAMPAALGRESKNWRKRFLRLHRSEWIARSVGRINDALAYGATFAGQPLPFRALSSVTIGEDESALAGRHWIILEKNRGVVEARNMAEFHRAVQAGDWPEAAAHMEPVSSAFNADVATPYLATTAEAFAASAKRSARLGNYDSAVNELLAAVALKPDVPQYHWELIAHCRVAKQFGLGERAIAVAKRRFPDAVASILHEAMLVVMAGRGLEAANILAKYIQAVSSINASARRAISFVLRNFARQCQSAGVETDAPQPLLLPKVMQTYMEDIETHASLWHAAETTNIFRDDSVRRRRLRDHSQALNDIDNRPVRMLLMTAGSWKFLLNLYSYINEHGSEFELRTYDMGALDERSSTTEHLHRSFAPVGLGLDADKVWQEAVEEDATLEELVNWCDVVFCEWAGRHAIWLSRFLPPEKRLILRLHSYEAFTPWPYFINFGGVDGIIYVAEHIKRFTEIQFRPSEQGVCSAVISNFNNLSGFARPKFDRAQRKLAMVGYANLNKDPIMAIEILADLSRDDPEWHLHLYGDHWDKDALGEEEGEYFRRFCETVQRLGLSESITFHGYTNDVPAALRNIGFILSCSQREGTHEAVLEGMATGAIPIIRRWPMVRALGAPETTYPDLTYFDTAAEAAEQIRHFSSPENFAIQSQRAINYALERFEQRAVYPKFAHFVRQCLGRRKS